ncbi:MAG: hypothetical protein ABIK65_00825 [Candidatus Eisenbacteria bacterium]
MIEGKERLKRVRSHLGDAWRNWDGDLSKYDWDVETSRNPFLLLFALFCIGVVGVAALLWYLIVPRLAEIHPRAPLATGFLFLFIGGGIVLVSLSVILSVLTNRRLLLTRLALLFLILAVRPMGGIAARFGFSRDRVENSFLKIHNTLVRLIDRGGDTTASWSCSPAVSAGTPGGNSWRSRSGTGAASTRREGGRRR